MRAQEVVAPCSQGQDRVASTSRAAQQTASRVLGAPDSRATAESGRAAARLLHNPPAAREVVNVREQGHRRRDHDEAVKMVNFSRDGKHEEEIVASKRANRCCRARGSPGVGRRSVMATRFARVSIHTNFKIGLSL